MKLLILLSIAVLVTGNPLGLSMPSPQVPTEHVVGGKVTPIEKIPHQVSVKVYGNHNCGGSIISEEWVLTAAHCVSSQRSYTVGSGTGRLSPNEGTLHTLVEVIVHEDYGTNSRGVPYNDIALLRVKERFQFDETRQPVPLYEDGEESVPGAEAEISGWGVTENGISPKVLYSANVPIVSKKDCDDAYKSYGGIPDGQVCAAYPDGGVDTCQGDSGGPMTINGRQAGIVSWGNGCGSPGYPGVYTEVAANRGWIRKITGI